MKKMFLVCLCFVMILTGCSFGNAGTDLGVVGLSYYDEMGEEGYNTDLFYRNDLSTRGADPGVVYISEGEYEGYFFLYGSDDFNSRGYSAIKSKDLVSWEFVGECFIPEDDSWGVSSMWAPEVIYDEDSGKYYMFYSATNTNQEDGYVNCKYLGLAVADKPEGPFVQYTGTNANGTEIGIGDPLFNIEFLGKDHPLYKEGTSFIDPKPFVDPETGDKYMYMCRNRNAHKTNIICVVKMKDWATPDYSTYTELTTVNRTTYNGDVATERTEGDINEGPWMIYHEGKYYLTMSINSTSEKEYSVIQAIGDSPMGPFEKIQESKGGVVLGVDLDWDHVSVAGGQSFAYIGDELYIVYHQNRDREMGGDMNRGYAIDRIEWVENEDGQTVMKANGPTNSIQPKPSAYTGYENLAKKAKVTATNVIKDSDAKYLNDGAVRIQEVDCVQEFYGKNKVKITMEFDDYVTAKSLLIYNSCFYEDSFYEVDKIDFSFRKEVDGKMSTGIARAENLYYDFEENAMVHYGLMRPGAPMILEFEELEINKVTITVTCPKGQERVGISEIMLLGKEAK